MPIECPHCRKIHTGNLSTHGLPFHRCPACQRFFPNPRRVPANKTVSDDSHPGRPVDSGHAHAAVEYPHTQLAEDEQDTDSERLRMPETQTELPSLVKLFADSIPSAIKNVPPAGLVMPEIPGFAMERILGRGGMGTVYLARQLSLDRFVALKVMSRRWVGDPVFVARFTREAYAAAQLNHPNLVQVYDIGEAGETRFFSMEYVSGRSIADLIKEEGKIDAETAVGYILQAARGLQHAHERGMIHRDIKPDNILVDSNGLVKVADLGLVKTPDVPAVEDRTADTWLRSDMVAALKNLKDMTGVRMALGTPAYMSPEQCRDAATVDHRADIYSLGCTLYVMLTGKPPFEGNTAVELMTKHAYQPLVPPEEIAARVPKGLSAVIQKMMAKHPGDRYSSMMEVIRVLEQWLGVHHTTRINAKEEHIAALEGWTERFHLAPTVLLRQRLLTGFLTSSLLAAVVMTFLGRLSWAFGIYGMVFQASLLYFVINGLARKTTLFAKVRQFVVGMSAGDWLITMATTAMFIVFLWMLQLFWIWLGFGLIGIGFALALRIGLDQAVDIERDGVLLGCHRLIRRLRKQGLDEEQVRQFVARYAGRYWEELFEAIFGYEAKLQARATLLRGEAAGPRETYASWRDPIIEFIDRIEKTRQLDRERTLLARTEKARLIASGMPVKTAGKRAAHAADAMLRQAGAIRLAEEEHRAKIGPITVSRPTTPRTAKIPDVRHLLATQADETATSKFNLSFKERWNQHSLGPLIRGMLGVALIAACLGWAVQNQVWILGQPGTLPLSVPGVSQSITNWCDTANVGWAGILLLTSFFYRGGWMTILVFLGSAITVSAHKLIGTPPVEPLHDFHIAAMLGTVFALVGYRLGTR